jgi:hypothetical protein
MYRNCVLADNTFEVGAGALEAAEIVFENCIIAGNKPFEQIWQWAQSKLFFINCVIAGANDTNGLIAAQKGTLFFSQCTFADAGFVCKIPANSKCDITIINSIIARCSAPFLEMPARAEGRTVLANNIYWDGKGNIYNGKKYDASNWDEYLKTGLEKYSRWTNPNLGGNLSTELPQDNTLTEAGTWFNPEVSAIIAPLIPEDSIIKDNKTPDGKACQIGARIPEKVWKAYFDLIKHDKDQQF